MGRNFLVVFIFWSQVAWSQGNYSVFHVDGQAGMHDHLGNEIIPAEYEEIGWTSGSSNLQEDVIGYKKDGKWGLVNLSNEPVTLPIYQQMLPAETELIVASKRGNFSTEEFFGIINVKGKLVIPFSYAGLEITGSAIIAQKHEYNRRVYGLIGLDNVQRLPFLYSNIYPIANDLYLVEKANSVSIVNNQGKEVITYPVDSISSEGGGYFITWKNGKKGVVDPKGKELLTPDFKEIRITQNSIDALAFSSWLFFQEENVIEQELTFDQIEEVGKDLYITKTNVQYRLLNTATNKESASFDQISQISPTNFIVKRDGVYGVTSTEGLTIPLEYDSIMYADGFIYASNTEQSAWTLFDTLGVKKSKYDYEALKVGTENRFPIRRNNRWGFLDRTGEEVISCVFDHVTSFQNGKSKVVFHEEEGIINKSGDWIIYPRNKAITIINDSLFLEKSSRQTTLKSFDNMLIYFTENPIQVMPNYLVETLDSTRKWRISFRGTIFDRSTSMYPDSPPVLFRDSLFIVAREGIKGVVSSSGEEIIPFENEDIKPGPNEFIAIKRDGFYGFVDMQNKLRIANRYEDVKPFSEELAAIQIRGKWGFINKDEEIVAQPIYTSVGYFENGVCDVEKDNFFGIINMSGKWVVSPTLDELKKTPGGNWITRKGNLYGLHNAKGRVILQTKFQSIVAVDQERFIVERKGLHGVVDQDGVMRIGFNYNHLEYHPKKQMFVAKLDGKWTSVPLFPQ